MPATAQEIMHVVGKQEKTRDQDAWRLKAVLSDPQFITLFVVVALIVSLIYFFSFQIVPFALALMLAYFLDTGVERLLARGLSRGPALALIFGSFLVGYMLLVLGPLPLLVERGVQLAGRIPMARARLATELKELPDLTFGLVSEARRLELVEFLFDQAGTGIQHVVKSTWSWLPQATTGVVYLFLIPLLVFFFLKDKHRLLDGCARCLPRNRQLVTRIWLDMEVKMGNYVRGKIWEILLVAGVTWLAFLLLGFDYPIVVGAISGISVLVPYVGAIAVAAPVAIMGFVQWGLGLELSWLLIVYTAIQLIDGNVVVPFIFSQAVKLHPVVILFAVILFGSLWGFWGVFFAIPLATLVNGMMVTLLDFRDELAGGARDGAPGGPAGGIAAGASPDQG